MMKTDAITAEQAYSMTKDTLMNPLNNPRYKRRYDQCWKAIMKKITKTAKEGRTFTNYQVHIIGYDPLSISVRRALAKALAVNLLSLGYFAHNNGNDTMVYIDWSEDRAKNRELMRLAYED